MRESFLIPVGSARAVALLTVASRVLGMIREMLFARLFGAGAVADAFQISFRLPNTFRRIFGEGAFASAMIPALSAVRENEGMEGTRRSAAALLGFLTRALLTLTALGICGIGAVAWLTVGSAADIEKARLTAWLSAILFPYVFLICMTAAQGGVLHVCSSFVVPALAPVLFNIVEILGLIGVGLWWIDGGSRENPTAIFWVAGSVLAAGALQYASQAWGLRRLGFTARQGREFDWKDPALRSTLVGLLPMVAGLAPAQIGVLVDVWMAELCIGRSGAVAHLSYGHLLIHLPLAVAAVSIATVSFPLFSRLAARGDRVGLSTALGISLRQVFFLLAPAAVGLGFLSVPIVRMIYEGRHFDPTATAWTAEVVRAYAWGLVAMGLQQILVRVLYALGDRRSPVAIGVGMVILNVALNLAWVRAWQEPGIALATSVSAWVGLLATCWTVGRHLSFRIQARALWFCLFRTLSGCAVLAGFLWNAGRFCQEGKGFASAAATLGAVLGGVALFVGVVWAAGSEELPALLRRGHSGASVEGAEETK